MSIEERVAEARELGFAVGVLEDFDTGEWQVSLRKKGAPLSVDNFKFGLGATMEEAFAAALAKIRSWDGL